MPTHYFHVVFTIDHRVNVLVRRNQRAVYNLLFAAATETLKSYGQRYLKGELGITAVLHTWSQEMTEHLHLHCIVTGGALRRDAANSTSSPRWQASDPTFLFPIVALSADFQAQFCQGLIALEKTGKLDTRLSEGEVDVAALVEAISGQRWEVYAKPVNGDPTHVLEYLSRYVNRIAIGNYRIVGISETHVEFTYYDNRDGGQKKTMRLSGVEFMRRFLLHVLPKGFVRIRYYGLHHSYNRRKLALCRRLLGEPAGASDTAKLDWSAWMRETLAVDPQQCPFCQPGRMAQQRSFGPLSRVKAGLMDALGVPARGRKVA